MCDPRRLGDLKWAFDPGFGRTTGTRTRGGAIVPPAAIPALSSSSRSAPPGVAPRPDRRSQAGLQRMARVAGGMPRVRARHQTRRPAVWGGSHRRGTPAPPPRASRVPVTASAPALDRKAGLGSLQLHSGHRDRNGGNAHRGCRGSSYISIEPCSSLVTSACTIGTGRGPGVSRRGVNCSGKPAPLSRDFDPRRAPSSRPQRHVDSARVFHVGSLGERRDRTAAWFCISSC